MEQVYVGIGSNIDRDANIRNGVIAVREVFGELELSSVYESAAYGFEGENFYNLVARFTTHNPVDVIAGKLKEIETRFGRKGNEQRFLSRTLDLDLLLYGNVIRHDGTCDLPREDIKCYSFVLCPLAEIAGNERHPELGRTYAEMWADFDHEKQPLWPINFIMPSGQT